MGKRAFITKTGLKIFLGIFIGFFILTFIYVGFVYTSLVKKETVLTLQNEKKIVSVQKSIILNFIDNLLLQSRAMAVNSEINEEFFSGDVSGIEYLKSYLTNQIMTDKSFREITVLDDKGNEIVRIINGHVINIVAGSLLKKHQEGQVADILEGKYKDGIISKISLEEFEGKISKPYVPVVKIFQPIHDRNENVLGVMIIKKDLRPVFTDLKNTKNALGGFSLLNSDGYWLINDNKEFEWSFLFGKDYKIQNLNLDVWNSVVKNKMGNVTVDKGLYTFETYNNDLFQDTVYLVSFIPRSYLTKSSNDFLRVVIITLFFSLLFTAFLTLLLANAMSRRYKAEFRAKRLNEMLKLINKILRHDIKNKLTAVMHSLALYKEDKDKVYLKIASDSTVRGIELINQMKEFELFLQSDGEFVSRKLSNIIAELRQHFNIKISLRGDENIDVDDAVMSIFDNLVNNSIVHGKATKITITVKREGADILIYVKDNGIGISEDARKYIFSEGFSTSGSSGLGLYIVRKMMERYGGSIKIEKTRGKGAQFLLVFPRG